MHNAQFPLINLLFTAALEKHMPHNINLLPFISMLMHTLKCKLRSIASMCGPVSLSRTYRRVIKT